MRLIIKLLLKKIWHLDSFCKRCGRKVRDFDAPDELWIKVESRIKYGHTLCYDCFCDMLREIGIPTVFRLELL